MQKKLVLGWGLALKGFVDFVFLLNYVILLIKCINDIGEVYMQFLLSINIVTSTVKLIKVTVIIVLQTSI